jgi:hypothetical protein
MIEYFKRIDAMLEQHQMPPEYANTQSHIYCNDCEKKCYSKYHFLYHKCVNCNGYNTKVLKTVEVEAGKGLLVHVDNSVATAVESPTGSAFASSSDSITAPTSPGGGSYVEDFPPLSTM